MAVRSVRGLASQVLSNRAPIDVQVWSMTLSNDPSRGSIAHGLCNFPAAASRGVDLQRHAGLVGL